MAKSNNGNRPPRRGPMGPGMGAPGEKAKNFKSAIKRLFRELKKFRIIIAIALVLAIASSILSISAPNRLSKLTDKISEGLVVNKDNLEYLAKEVPANFATRNYARSRDRWNKNISGRSI